MRTERAENDAMTARTGFFWRADIPATDSRAHPQRRQGAGHRQGG
jgi:hypothetical protein